MDNNTNYNQEPETEILHENTPNYNQNYQQNYQQPQDYNQGYQQNYQQSQGYNQGYQQNYQQQGYNQNYQQNYQQPQGYNQGYNYNAPTDGKVPGKGAAIGSLVMGICSLAIGWAGVGLICGIVGVVLAVMAKNKGFDGGLQKGGLVTSIIGLIFGAIIFVSCLACGGFAACASCM